jgi:hypothetical protein
MGRSDESDLIMDNIETQIVGSEKLTAIFGYWPSFHDAEVIELSFWRGEVNPEMGLYTFPALTAKLHLWELTNEVNSKGFLVLRKHTLATIRFHDVLESRIEGFNHQNAILGLDIRLEEPSEGPSPVLAVTFRSAFGMDASLKCMRMEVLEAVACTENGTLG